MHKVEMYLRVRRACRIDGMGAREAARVFGLHRDAVRKMLKYSAPPGNRREGPPSRPKLDPYKGVTDQILEQDQSSPKKQRHTAKRIYERLRDEHGLPGKYTIEEGDRGLRISETDSTWMKRFQTTVSCPKRGCALGLRYSRGSSNGP